MAVSIWITVLAGLITFFTGFWVGRGMKQMAEETERRVQELEDGAVLRARDITGKRAHAGKSMGDRAVSEWLIVSPVSGELSCFYENNRCRVSVRPQQECLYAPVSGRIKKMYPMGNAMLITSEAGVDILMTVGAGADELCNGYFRPRVVQSEVINKGKLLLEFERAGLEKAGVDVTVDISVEQVWKDKNIAVTQSPRINVGEALLWV